MMLISARSRLAIAAERQPREEGDARTDHPLRAPSVLSVFSVVPFPLPRSLLFFLPCLLLALPGGVLLAGCGEGDTGLQARQIAEPAELIGGPAAKGKVGDFLLQNDQLRAIVAGPGQTWLGNTFGGSLVDVDRVRRGLRSDRHGQGWDCFAEQFPLVNLIIADPAKPMRRLETAEGSVEVRARLGGVSVLADGSDGQQAAVRVQGAGAYLFQAIKLLNRDFLRAMIQDFEFAGIALPLRDLARQLLDPNMDLYSLLNRLQLDFNFTTDYIVQPGKPYIIIRTTVDVAPPSDASLAACPKASDCQLGPGDCAHGFVLEQVAVPQPGESTDVPLLCPVCACAGGPVELIPFTEQRSIFGDMLGDLDQWVLPGWRGGIVGGDFLFFGAQASIFIPGQGYDDDSRVFENMWQGVGSLASPFVYPWLAGTGVNVSYAFTTVNPQERPAAACPTHRMAILAIDPEGEEAVAEALQLGFGMTKGSAVGLVRGSIVDRNPIPLPVGELPTDAAAATADLEGWRQQVRESWWASALASWGAAEGDAQPVPGLPRLGADALARVQAAFETYVRLGLLPAASCGPAQMMVPIFSTSATAVMTHEDIGELDVDGEGGARQTRQRFTWERYLVVGDGDVGSTLETVYALRDEPVGWVEGVVLEDGSGSPVHHAHVFAVRDPRAADGGQERFASWEALRKANLAAFGNPGVVSQMQTDLGLDPTHDGDYRGPLPPGRYFLVAKTANRRASRPVPVTVRAGRTEVAHLVLEPEGHLSLRIYDESGQLSPGKATLVQVDEQGREMSWEGHGQPVLGDSRFDRGIRRAEFSTDGTLELDAEPGRYKLYVSRGIEYSIISRELELTPGRPVTVEAQLIHEVDTTGYIAGDFHVHASPSVDAAMALEDRVKAVVAEGVEFVTATDHDTVTDYMPYIEELRLKPYLASQRGVETTTLEFGHFNGYPLRYDRRDWSVHDPPPWFGLPTSQMIAELRRRAAGDPRDFVVQINHPFDGFMGYFAQAGVHGYDLQRDTPGMEMCNPQTEQIACNFDALELMNEKRFELVRTPTVQEVADHNRCYQEILGTHRLSAFVLPRGAARVGDPGVAETACGWLQVGPADCAAVAQALAGPGLDEAQRLELLDARDLCRWAAELRRGFARCGEQEVDLITCKRSAIDALKHFSVRRMLQRTPSEQEAFRTLQPERDPGCDLDKAMTGCSPNLDAQNRPKKGCGGEDCLCEACVCATHPSCCASHDPQTGEGGWTEQCADACRTECLGCGLQPCTDRTQMLDSWFTMLNQGFVVTGMGNSDSHNRVKEVGLPRNFVRSSTDRPQAVDPHELNRAVRRHQVILSTGPFLEMSILGAEVGETASLPQGATTVPVHVRVQTPSWFGVDRLEIYRNGRLERRLRLEGLPSAVTDHESTLSLPRPDEDSWYVAVTYGLDRSSELSPVYGSLIYGHLLIPTVIGLGLGQILGGFDSLMAKIESTPIGPMLEGLLASAAGGLEMPDNFPTLPVAITNPIWLDVDGGGFTAPGARLDPQGNPVLPPFCAQPCPVVLDPENGEPTQSTCGANQICRPDEEGAAQGTCTIPIPASCPPDVFGGGGPGSAAGALGVSQHALRGLGPSEPPWSATRVAEKMLRRAFLGQGN